MKFKEVKPGMVIHCPTEETVKALYEYLEELGFTKIVYMLGQVNTCPYTHRDLLCYKIEADTSGKLTTYFCRLDSAKREGYTITEFSDLIEPDENLANKANDLANQRDNEMTAVEVLEWLKYVGKGTLVNLFGTVFCDEILLNNTPQEIIDKITAYEAAKKEKPVELEWVNIVRIIDEDTEKCVQKIEIIGGEITVPTENALKEYRTHHEGNYYAVVERRCQVKGEQDE